jgi:hypothetical protein
MGLQSFASNSTAGFAGPGLHGVIGGKPPFNTHHSLGVLQLENHIALDPEPLSVGFV